MDRALPIVQEVRPARGRPCGVPETRPIGPSRAIEGALRYAAEVPRARAPLTVVPIPRSPARPGLLLAVLLSAVGCRPSATVPPDEPDPPPPELPSYREMTADLTPLDLSPDPLPEGVAAAVDGEAILEAEVETIAQLLRAAVDSEPVDEDVLAVEALRWMVEQRLLLAKADQMDIRISEAELDVALERVTAERGITREEFEAEITSAGGTWEEYRDSLVAQLLQRKVLEILGVFGPGSIDDDATQERRSRVVGCLQARAEVQVRDETIVLPENPFALVAKLGELHFVGEVILPEPELRAAALEAGKTRMRLCDALTSAELVIQEMYLEAGYLEADVRMPWPTDLDAPVAVDVLVTPGRPHVVGKVRFDQSAVPKRGRLDETELRKRLVGFVSEGDVAAMSVLRATDEEIVRAIRQEGMGPVEIDVARKEGRKRVRLDITYRIVPAPKG